MLQAGSTKLKSPTRYRRDHSGVWKVSLVSQVTQQWCLVIMQVRVTHEIVCDKHRQINICSTVWTGPGCERAAPGPISHPLCSLSQSMGSQEDDVGSKTSSYSWGALDRERTLPPANTFFPGWVGFFLKQENKQTNILLHKDVGQGKSNCVEWWWFGFSFFTVS